MLIKCLHSLWDSNHTLVNPIHEYLLSHCGILPPCLRCGSRICCKGWEAKPDLADFAQQSCVNDGNLGHKIDGPRSSGLSHPPGSAPVSASALSFKTWSQPVWGPSMEPWWSWAHTKRGSYNPHLSRVVGHIVNFQLSCLVKNNN